MPQDEASQAQSAQYLQAWDAIGELLDAGRSWSGRERNACFLNTADGRFASISGLAGLDQSDDSRAVAIVDWDRDGDLDLWVSNRTAPRLRFLRNELNQDNHFVSIKLEGRRSNRDAIGARVELVFAHDVGSNRFKTLRAGEGYLSQTTKWLHFPLPEGEEVATALVRWPGSGVERFERLSDTGRYRLVEGTGKAELLTDPKAPKLAAGPALVARSTDAVRMVPHSSLPLPRLDYVNLEGSQARLVSRRKGNRMLVTLWATWCAPCLAEMKELEANSGRLKELGVELHPLNVENLEDAVSSRLTQVKRYYGRNRLSSVGGLATADLVEVLDAVQRTIVGRQKPLPVPCSFLIDEEGDLSVIYKGRIDLETLLEDSQEMVRPTKEDRERAIPLQGRWYVNSFGADIMALPKKLLEISKPVAALSYLQRHLGLELAHRSTSDHGIQLSESEIKSRDVSVAELYRQAGGQLSQVNHRSKAIESFEAALVFVPDSYKTKVNLAVTLQANGSYKAALRHFHELNQIRPGEVAVLNSLAWMLATADEAALQDPALAVRYAEEACSVMEQPVAALLDSLAAAYAAAMRFEEAVETASKAISTAETAGESKTANAIRKRLTLYQQKLPFRSPSVSPK